MSEPCRRGKGILGARGAAVAARARDWDKTLDSGAWAQINVGGAFGVASFRPDPPRPATRASGLKALPQPHCSVAGLLWKGL
ncbi:hypothetical protein LEN_1711 [Lysobacter enzymogenes]|uniref:Uncharacterized protein n=1 Tax=Lysobacter enzymogenes TaxID=69 RepID=A0AAU9AGX2_LYSEN|nr:hypothetical protein LEN_1711 [Lysobacter enzymogenes]